jgi:hypothetical protein
MYMRIDVCVCVCVFVFVCVCVRVCIYVSVCVYEQRARQRACKSNARKSKARIHTCMRARTSSITTYIITYLHAKL